MSCHSIFAHVGSWLVKGWEIVDVDLEGHTYRIAWHAARSLLAEP
jgi:hypothetical protein